MASTSGCPPFEPEVEIFSEFIQRFELQCLDLLQKARNDERRKIAILLKCLPVKIITDLQRRIKPVAIADTSYDDVVASLRSQYEVKKSLVGAAFNFFSRKQGPDESIECYSRALNDLAAACEYKDCCRDRIIRDVFICGLNSPTVLAAVLQKGEELDFSECVSYAKTVTQLAFDVQDVSSDSRIHKLSHNLTHTTNSPKVPDDSYVCMKCGERAKHFVNDCFARKLRCKKCKKLGHLQSVCKSANKVHHTEVSSVNSGARAECCGATGSSGVPAAAVAKSSVVTPHQHGGLTQQTEIDVAQQHWYSEDSGSAHQLPTSQVRRCCGDSSNSFLW